MKTRMIILAAFLAISALNFSSFSQVYINGQAKVGAYPPNSLEPNVISGTNLKTTTDFDYRGVYGKSCPAPNWGVGGMFEGGYVGVTGISNITGLGSRTGGQFAAGGGGYNVGVWATGSTYAGYFNGNVVVTGTFSNPSDAKLKKNIKRCAKSLNKILQLGVYNYEYDTQNNEEMELPEGEKTGLIAQEVESVFPSVVHNTVAPSKDKGEGKIYKSVDYIALIPLLIQALQEQQAQIDDLKKRVK